MILGIIIKWIYISFLQQEEGFKEAGISQNKNISSGGRAASFYGSVESGSFLPLKYGQSTLNKGFLSLSSVLVLVDTKRFIEETHTLSIASILLHCNCGHFGQFFLNDGLIRLIFKKYS